MIARDHAGYREDIGAYLLGALTDLERQAFERHMSGCAECRDELERLRPAAYALPRSVEQMEPPPGLRSSLMEVVEREARERQGAPARPRRRPLRMRLPSLAGIRPVLVAGALALGLVGGFGVAQLADGEEDGRTVAATVDESRVPLASATLQVQGDGEDGAILRVHGMPSLDRRHVYQAWVQRDGTMLPQPTFDVGEDGGGAVAVPDDVSEAQAILVTREPSGGARAPSERPLIRVPL
ncbi:MAG: anti-sigma factor domain-containing protein [Thermoleophilaceae bacterium]